MKAHRSTAGFSLLEVLVVLSIMTLLAGAALPLVGKNVTRGKITETRAELAAMPTAVSAYFEDTGSFPPSFDDLQQNVSAKAGWAGPYMVAVVSANGSTATSLSQDAWNRNYVVATSGASGLTITSRGPDGVASADDIVQSVDVTPVRRAHTVDELRTINSAITSWNATHLPATPLPQSYPALLAALVAGGYLPGGTNAWDSDGWGSAYVPSPPGASPVVAVTSPNL